jgi:diguanylate cyclase (GGDEF)-like protein
MSDTAIEIRPSVRFSTRTLLAYSLWVVIAIHAGLILALGERAVAASRLATAAIPVLAAVCFLWRARRVPFREQFAWRWLSVGVLLWAGGQVVETFIGRSNAASNLSVDASDFLYITAAFPILLAISRTRETESIRAVAFLDAAQILLAFGLACVRLFHMSLPPEQAATVMGRIYGAECSLLAVLAILRLVSWSTREERRRIRLLCAVVWLYLPVELGMDYASSRWNLRAGTLLDLLWSVPFVFAGWRALFMSREENPGGGRTLGRGKLLIESLCPALVTAGIFALAASIASQHLVLALGAIFLLFALQSLHAGAVQLNYVVAQQLLVQRERELRAANSNLERLSLIDPLTGIPNRRCFTSSLEDAWRRGLRSKGPVAVLMVDVDFFKGINDMHGHAYGDQCLATIARTLGQQALRAYDLIARYGGEEFVLLLPDTDTEGALVVAERMRAAIAELDIPNRSSPFNERLTLSVGVATAVPKAELAPSRLVETADQALYEAKHLGRNRVCSRGQV